MKLNLLLELTDKEKLAAYNARKRERYAKMTPEEKRAYLDQKNKWIKNWISKMTPEEKRAFLDRQKKVQRKYYANMTPEEKRAYLDRQNEFKKKYFSRMTPEEKRAYLDRQNEFKRERYANMTPEEKRAFLDKKKIYGFKNWISKMTPEEKRAYMDKFNKRRRDLRLLSKYNASNLKDVISINEYKYLLDKINSISGNPMLKKILFMKYGFGNKTMTNQEIANVFGFQSEYNVEDIIDNYLNNNKDLYVDSNDRLRRIKQ